MGKIDYQKIYDYNRRKWEGLTDEPEKYEALLAGHYSDSNHFIYELLQNAEDADATKVVIECYNDRLVFYHNGTPFNEDDVRGVSSMLMGTKGDRNSAQKIGHFGMGFKSVFKYTNIPEIYSDEEAFRIERYLLPVQITGNWDYNETKKKIVCKTGEHTKNYPFYNDSHLTRFVIPFIKINASGEEVVLSSDEVMKKLEELDGRILLFLSSIHELYWEEKCSGKYAYISLSAAEQDSHLITCRIDSSNLGGNEQISRFLRFNKVFEHKDMKYCNVSIAYRMNARANNINPMKDQCMWVYFPTKDETKLQFLAHGSFETAVSREKLMAPSNFNNDLYKAQIDLICESLKELKKRKLITQSFLRQVLIPSFEEERLEGLKEAIICEFKDNAYLPDTKGGYLRADEALIPIPFSMADFSSKSLFAATFCAERSFVSFNDNNSAGFQEYFLWLKDKIGVSTFTIDTWARCLLSLRIDSDIDKKSVEYNNLVEFYDFLSDHRSSLHQSKRSSGSAWSQMLEGNYESLLRQSVTSAWEILKRAPIILNMRGRLVPAYKDGKPCVYSSSSSRYKRLAASSIIDSDIAEQFRFVLEEGFEIAQFDNYQYVKEKVIKKYIEGDDINFESTEEEDREKEYIEDLQQIFALLDEGRDAEEVQNMLQNAYIIRVKEDDNVFYNRPDMSYPPVSDEGFDMGVYLEGIEAEEDRIEVDFYEQNGISIEKLRKLGIYSSVVDYGERDHEGSVGDPEWHAMGEYCPFLRVDYFVDNIEYIVENPDEEISKRKSALLLDWSLRNYQRLAGKVRHNKTNVRVEDEECRVLSWSIKDNKWLYNNKEDLCCTSEISKYELNRDIYGPVSFDKEAYETLGFAVKEQDEAADAFSIVESMDDKQQELLMKQLARKYGYVLERNEEVAFDNGENDALFNMDNAISTDFPNKKVKNIERLRAHVRSQFFCADPTKYQQVLRQIRISKDPKMVREYVSGMYTNDEGVRICQMCNNVAYTMEATEIANFGIEMDQLNLCLCPNCSATYKMFRDNDKDRFRDAIREALLEISIDYDDDYEEEYELEISDEESVFFNQIHITEIQEILELLDQYGVPESRTDEEEKEGPLGPYIRKNMEVLDSEQETIDEPNKDGLKIARAGRQISYRKLFDVGEICNNVLQPNKFPLHKALEGHEIGDVVSFRGKEYEIVDV